MITARFSNGEFVHAMLLGEPENSVLGIVQCRYCETYTAPIGHMEVDQIACEIEEFALSHHCKRASNTVTKEALIRAIGRTRGE